MATLSAERQASALQVALRQFGARLFEAAPGLVTWILLLAPAWIPIIFQSPGALAVAAAVLLFDIYWLLRSVTVVTGVYSTLWRMRRDMAKNWLGFGRGQPTQGRHAPPRDGQAGRGERRAAEREVWWTADGLLPHQGSTGARHRDREIGRH